MSAWHEQYSTALRARDQREKANILVFNAYEKLAGRASILESERARYVESQPSEPVSTETPKSGEKRTSSGINPLLVANQDLAIAQKSREELSKKLEQATARLDTLTQQLNAATQKAADLAVIRTQLKTRLKDRDEELKGKAKLLDDVQDELVSLNLQFNMAEERSKRLEDENQQLVDRWMARMGQEADAMNKASRFS